MKCHKCGEYAETAGDVRRCAAVSAGCQDGTAQQIHPMHPDTMTLDEVFTKVPGLGNRFVPGSAPVVAEEGQQEENAGTEVEEGKPTKGKPTKGKPRKAK